MNELKLSKRAEELVVTYTLTFAIRALDLGSLAKEEKLLLGEFCTKVIGMGSITMFQKTLAERVLLGVKQ